MYRPEVIYDKIRLNKYTLSFDSDEVEKEFTLDYIKKLLVYVRASFVLAIILYLLFAFLDSYFLPELANIILFIRVAVVFYFLFILYITYLPVVFRYFQYFLISGVIIGSAGIIIMIIISGLDGNSYYGGLMLIIIWANSFLGLRFIYAAVTIWSVLIIYEILIISAGVTPTGIILANSFFLISANILCMVSSYIQEYHRRTLFLQSNSLKAEYTRKSTELESAKQIQLSMLPSIVPLHPSIEISVSMTTAAEIGGDYYDFKESGNSIIFAIGDATGHGARAGAMVTAAKILFCNFATKGDPLEFIKFSSCAIKQMNLPNLYMAMAAGVISPDNLEITGAGLPPALLYRDSKQSIEQIILKGLPLGSYGGLSYYKVQKVHIAKGDTLFFMTDGLLEMFNSKGEMFGMERCINEFRKTAQLSADKILKHFKITIKEWLNGLLQSDDITLMIFKIKG